MGWCFLILRIFKLPGISDSRDDEPCFQDEATIKSRHYSPTNVVKLSGIESTTPVPRTGRKKRPGILPRRFFSQNGSFARMVNVAFA
jgi:hypothetical protein